MRFDDVLETVLSTTQETPQAAAAAWRQLVDLVGRGRVVADEQVLQRLRALQAQVPATVRGASARALAGAEPPLALVALLACDEASVGTPLLRHLHLSEDDWTTLLPLLSPTARAVLRHRRDLSPAVVRALESFGAVDFVLPDGAAREAPVAAASIEPAVTTMPADPSPFVAVGSLARAMPLVAEALRRGEERSEAVPAPLPDGTFRIADVVARIEAFKRGDTPAPANDTPALVREQFRFETDVDGVIRWVEGVARGAVIGISLAVPAAPGGVGVDGGVAGAFRRRSAITDARLLLAGGAVQGIWLIGAVPVFDQASGRFTGYRGAARRPAAHEQTGSLLARRADALRQLVHELRTPTNAIAGFSEMIEHQLLGPVPPIYRDHAAAIRSEASRLLTAIEDLDAAARSEAGALELNPEPLALADLLARALAELGPLRAARGCSVALETIDASVFADRRTLERLLLRLLGTLVGAGVQGEVLTGVLRANGPLVELSITKPRAFAEHQDDAILRLDEENGAASLLGTGFTLRLVRNLAQALGGTLALQADRLTLALPSAGHAGAQAVGG